VVVYLGSINASDNVVVCWGCCRSWRVGGSRHQVLIRKNSILIPVQNTAAEYRQNTNWRIFQRYFAQELVHIYLRRASALVYGDTRAKCTVQVYCPTVTRPFYKISHQLSLTTFTCTTSKHHEAPSSICCTRLLDADN
jgi:hypothetical protein